MIVVTINSGSTSIKLAAFEVRGHDDVIQIEHDHRSGDQLDDAAVLREFLAKLPRRPDTIAHRVVHGGTRFKGPVIIDAAVLGEIAQLSELAPLHNPKAVEWIKCAQSVADPKVVQVAVFDTSFFAHVPRLAAEYALPAKLGVDEGVRRYGFHGLAHEALWKRWSQLHTDLPRGGRVITLQLGGGASIAAIDQGRPLDMTMGFSPLEGLVMGTRSGDVDPSVVPYLQRRLGKTSDEIIQVLNRECGVAGMTAGGTNLGDLAADANAQSQFAVDLYCYRARKYIGAFLTVLGGCDGIVFGGGVGEHVPEVRRRILAGMDWAGIELDTAANESARGQEARIDSSRLPVRVQVIPVEEEGVMVCAAQAVSSSK